MPLQNTIETDVKTQKKAKVDKPALYKVVMINDDYTPMDFVVFVLQNFFGKSEQEAIEIMLQIHNHGIAVCGLYSYEIAETKAHQVISFALQNEHPLQCKLEKE